MYCGQHDMIQSDYGHCNLFPTLATHKASLKPLKIHVVQTFSSFTCLCIVFYVQIHHHSAEIQILHLPFSCKPTAKHVFLFPFLFCHFCSVSQLFSSSSLFPCKFPKALFQPLKWSAHCTGMFLLFCFTARTVVITILVRLCTCYCLATVQEAHSD